MSSALQLIATNTIINGQGLYTSANLLASISTYQSHGPIKLIANVYATAMTNSNIAGDLPNVLANIGVGVTSGAQWLVDLYPGNISPVCSGAVSTYEEIVTPILGNPHTVDGNVVYDIIGYNHYPITSTASWSNTLKNQGLIPFSNGMAGFANVYNTAYSYTVSTFETVASVNLLQGKTYAQMGLGYTGPVDLVTNGINYNGALIANVVAGWGTMYDITNISKCGDIYVFGQNILNQGLGTYGGLTTQLTNAGLNVYNLSQVSPSKTVVTQAATTFAATTPIGAVHLPTIGNVVTTTSAVGNSSDVVTAIYASVTGTDLEAMVLATGVTTSGTNLTTLADYLNFEKVVGSAYYPQFVALGITDFVSFGQYLNNKVGKGIFTSWADVAKFLSTIEVPTVPYTTATANTVVLPDSIANSLLAAYGTGSGPFKTTILQDYLGAAAGIPYTGLINTINNNYSLVSTAAVTSALQSLDSSVTTYIAQVNYDIEANTSTADIAPVISSVNTVNTALNTVPASTALSIGTAAYYNALNQLSVEVANISRAGITFGASYPQVLRSFAGRIGSVGASQNGNGAYEFFANLITSDTAGDTIRLAIVENNNTSSFNYKGISVNNDPNPRLLINQADAQNIPLSTYIKQNK